MFSARVKARISVALAVLMLLPVSALPALAAPDDGPAAKPTDGWTLDQALEHLRYYPDDVYVQYVALQLARREGKLSEVTARLEPPGRVAARFSRRQEQVDLFSIFSGALAVQESLQLDAMRGEEPEATQPSQPGQRRIGPPPLQGQDGVAVKLPISSVTVATLVGPTIKSHPWKEMLAGRSPEISQLARSVPVDFYFAEFRSPGKLIEAMDLGDLWGAHLMSQSEQQAQTQLVGQRLRTQLAVEDNPLLRPIYDAVVEEVAVTGSDLFVREGSDVTLLFRFGQPQVFRAKMDDLLTQAEESRADARRSTGNYQGIEFVHVGTPDRQINVYSAYPSADLHVRSNSRVALERVLDAIRGKSANGQPVERLGDTDEFAYIRTIMPAGAAEEDGFVYLSDAFIRRMVGPQLRLTEQRRLMCYNHLKMISHGALMYRTERGANPESLDLLEASDCTPGQFGQGRLACPEGGEYSLAADGLTGVCSHHGYASSLTPCTEIETTHVTPAEADAYRRFLEEYNTYWRQFFDPIAIRLQITPERYRVETVVLPLIDNSLYTRLAATLGGEPENLDALPVPERNIFSFAVRLDKQAVMQQLGIDNLLEEDHQDDSMAQMAEAERQAVFLQRLALAMHMYHDAYKRFSMAVSIDAEGRPLLSWRVQLLPFLGHKELYDEFKLDEPWDSPHNLKLVTRMPLEFEVEAKKGTPPKIRRKPEDCTTRFVVPRGVDTVFPKDNQQIGMPKITDGTSNTIMILEADEDHAVIWTKPDDWTFDPSQPLRGLAVVPPNNILVAMCDGSVRQIDRSIDGPTMSALLTRSGREQPDWRQFDRTTAPRPQWRGPFGLPEALVRDLRPGELLTRGIGNQIAFNVYDADPAFDLSMTQLMGLSVGSFRGRGGFNDDMLGIALLIGSLNSPVYVSIPVQDASVVDDFLDRLDKVLAERAREQSGGFFFRVDQDFYQLEPEQGSPARGYALRVGPLKWRFFWERIGDAVYVASKRDILDDLRAMQLTEQTDAAGDDRPAHALVRVRPQHWNQVLPQYRLGWEENNRDACLNNVGPLSSLSRALTAGRAADSPPASNDELLQATARLYDTHYFCPDGGKYGTSSGGHAVSCSIHGSAHEPRQPAVPTDKSKVAQLMQSITDVSATLIFLEDGLHAVVTVERESK